MLKWGRTVAALLTVLGLGILVFLALAPHLNTFNANLKQLASVQRLMVVYAHPDDEVMSAGLLKSLTLQGTRVFLVTLTDGRANPKSIRSACPEPDMFACRKRELYHSAEILGIEQVLTPAFPDSKLNEHVQEASAYLLEKMRTFQPDALLTVEPSGLNRQTDHMAASEIALSALSQLRDGNILVLLSTLPFPINLALRTRMPASAQSLLKYVPLQQTLLDAKVASAQAHPSQWSTLEGISLGLGPRALFEWMNMEAYYILDSEEVGQHPAM